MAQVPYGCPQPSSHCRASQRTSGPSKPRKTIYGRQCKQEFIFMGWGLAHIKQSGIFFVGAKAVPTGECSLILNEQLGILMRIRGWPEEHRALGMGGMAPWDSPQPSNHKFLFPFQPWSQTADECLAEPRQIQKGTKAKNIFHHANL